MSETLRNVQQHVQRIVLWLQIAVHCRMRMQLRYMRTAGVAQTLCVNTVDSWTALCWPLDNAGRPFC
jgi:hypothetical protein